MAPRVDREQIAAGTRDFLQYLGGLSILAAQTIRQIFRRPFEMKIFLTQLDQIGVKSMSIVVITAAFIGMVLALQTAYALEDFGGKLFVGTIVAPSWLAGVLEPA
jgi:phospholipid/cholesterol/gamma-HCH transport system permease protein